MTSINEPLKIKTEDGYTFFRLEDGRYADNLAKENIDMSWPDYQSMISNLHMEKISYSVIFD